MIIRKKEFFGIFGDGYAPGVSGKKFADQDDRRVLLALARHHNPRTVIEFGINDGITAELLLREVDSIMDYVGIDLPPGKTPQLDSQAREIPTEPAALVKGDNRLLLVLADSRTLNRDDLPRADFIYIDGGHDYETVKADTALAMELIDPGGVICWHDYVHDPGIGVPRLIDEINVREGNHITLVEGTRVCFTIRSGGQEKKSAPEPVVPKSRAPKRPTTKRKRGKK